MGQVADLMDAVINLMNQKAEEQKDLKRERAEKANYDAAYCAIANNLVSLFDTIQPQKKCFEYYDVAVISRYYRYIKNSMAFHVPYVAGISDNDRRIIEELIKQGLLQIIANIYPRFSRIDVFAESIMKVQRTSYGFDLIML